MFRNIFSIPENRKQEQEKTWNSVASRKNGVPKKPNEGYERGVASEERFLQICRMYQRLGRFPSWLLEVRPGTVEDDHNGIDMNAHTTDGMRIPIQIKSSVTGKLKFHEDGERSHIICIAIMRHRTDEDIFSETIQEVSYIWEAVCCARAAKK